MENPSPHALTRLKETIASQARCARALPRWCPSMCWLLVVVQHVRSSEAGEPVIFTQSGWRYGRQALRGNADVVIKKVSGVYTRLYNWVNPICCGRFMDSMRCFSGLRSDMGSIVNAWCRKPKKAARRAALFVLHNARPLPPPQSGVLKKTCWLC